MASDRRKSDTRRNSDRRTDSDRREKQDRRTKNGRRTAESSAVVEPSGKKASSGFSAILLFKSLIKKLAILFSLFIVVLTIVLVYFFAHLEYYMEKISQSVSVQMTKAELDAESLTDKTTRARVFFKVTNDLPFDIRFQGSKLNAQLADYTVAKGVQVLPGKRVKAKSATIIAIGFHVDSIMTRRGLQKAVKNNTGAILKSLSARLQGNKQAITDNLKGILKVTGIADLKLLVGGIEIPFTVALSL
jgi:LEA14-like dessication related protein